MQMNYYYVHWKVHLKFISSRATYNVTSNRSQTFRAIYSIMYIIYILYNVKHPAQLMFMKVSKVALVCVLVGHMDIM